MGQFPKIASNPAILGGKPCITGTRLSVEFIVELAASGASVDQIVATYAQPDREAVEQSLRYAARFLRNEIDVVAEIHS
ncbi:MAG: DUF433 domain-containing protein [Phycisphaeraceae bacterium]